MIHITYGWDENSLMEYSHDHITVMSLCPVNAACFVIVFHIKVQSKAQCQCQVSMLLMINSNGILTEYPVRHYG